MDSLFSHVASAIALAIFFGGAGAIFALGIIGISRWLKWAPINITVNVNDYRETRESASD